MADQNTKTLTNPRQERKGPPAGGIGFFESLEDIYRNSFELAARGQGDFVNEGLEAKNARHEVEQSKLSPEGTIRGFHKQRGIEDVYPEIADRHSAESIAERLNTWKVHIPEVPVADRRVKVNDLLGFQQGYKVPLDEYGMYTGEYYETETEKAEAELIDKQQREADRTEALSMATGKRASSKATVSGGGEENILIKKEGNSPVAGVGDFTGG